LIVYEGLVCTCKKKGIWESSSPKKPKKESNSEKQTTKLAVVQRAAVLEDRHMHTLHVICTPCASWGL